MLEAEIYARLTEIFREVLSDDTIVLRAETTARDIPAWDSLRMVLIAIAVEQRFGIELNTRDLDLLAEVGDLVGAIYRKVNAR
jgi:acyl carrier protein